MKTVNHTHLLNIPEPFDGVTVGPFEVATSSSLSNTITMINTNNCIINDSSMNVIETINDLIKVMDEHISKENILESLGDLVALEKITGPQYFNMKAMLNSPDEESRNLARTIIIEKSKYTL